MVSVHGEFLETNERGTELRRSFDRTFLLGPPAPTNPGSQCVVVSDILVLRPFSGRDSWIPEADAAPVDPNALIQEVRRRTGMNEHYAGILLSECNGDIEAGMRRFEEAKVFSTFVFFANVLGNESDSCRSISVKGVLLGTGVDSLFR